MANLPLKAKKRPKRASRPPRSTADQGFTAPSSGGAAPHGHYANAPQFSRRRKSRGASDTHGELVVGLIGLLLVASMGFWLFVYPLL